MGLSGLAAATTGMLDAFEPMPPEAPTGGRTEPPLADADTLPDVVPRELRLTGWQLQAGVQVGLK